MSVNVVGEFVNDIFVPGISKRPSFKSAIRLIRFDELEKVYGSQNLVRDLLILVLVLFMMDIRLIYL